MSAELNFLRQQGLEEASQHTCAYQYPAMMLQPRAIGILVLIGLILQSWIYFLVLCGLVWFSAGFPALNPFDALYNRLVAKRKGLPRMGPARPPRRFAQGMAGSFMFAIALALYARWLVLAYVLEVFLVVAIAALVFGRFCLGSYTFYLMTGRSRFANDTLPWASKR